MSNFPRAALFADTFHEVNGAANVLRRLTDFARERQRPFLCVRAGEQTELRQDGTLTILELKRSRAAIKIDGQLRFDPLFWRHRKLIRQTLADFKPDVLHLTGLNDVSQLGFYFAHFNGTSAVASWHTNTHEYAARRLVNLLRWMPAGTCRQMQNSVENCVMRGLMKLYFLAQAQLAPNAELVAQIQRMTNRPSFLMSRGVDTDLFSPCKRTRSAADKVFTIGYVGRLRIEKNVRFLAEVDAALQKAEISNYKFLIVGEGNEDEWLRQNLRNVELTGVLRGENLARAFADMDLFAFPSTTDAFGNVVLEAMAAGVAPVVMPEGGPKFLIDHAVNGFTASSPTDFVNLIARCAAAPAQLAAVKAAARASALNYSWEQVFENVYAAYHLAQTSYKGIRATDTPTIECLKNQLCKTDELDADRKSEQTL